MDFGDITGLLGALLHASIMLIGAGALLWGMLAWLFR